MATETQNNHSETLEGQEPITPEGTRLSEGPKPQEINGKYRCPLCGADFKTLQLYRRHEHDEHKVGTSTSTAIY